MYALLLGREQEGRQPFLHLLFLKCLQLKTINMPKRLPRVGRCDSLQGRRAVGRLGADPRALSTESEREEGNQAATASPNLLPKCGCPGPFPTLLFLSLLFCNAKPYHCTRKRRSRSPVLSPTRAPTPSPTLEKSWARVQVNQRKGTLLGRCLSQDARC